MTTTAQHTQWRIKRARAKRGLSQPPEIVDRATGDTVCLLGWGSVHCAASDEHAALIVAAPETAAERNRLKEVNVELLAACQRALAESVGQPSYRISRDGLDIIRAAIARATS